MSVWLFVGGTAVLVALTLMFAGRAKKGLEGEALQSLSNEDHFKVQLAEIEADVKSGRLATEQAEAAKAELARELMHHRSKAIAPAAGSRWVGAGLVVASLGTVGLAIAIYAFLGTPDQPAAPMSARLAEEGSPLNLAQAIASVEKQLLLTPNDIEGWRVLAPAYMRASRFTDATNAYRRILELAPPNADALTDLAQALLFENQGVASPEAIEVLERAVEMDPTHPRSRFFLAGNATRQGDWDNAISQWNELISLANGDEPWLDVAKNGLSVAMARGELTSEETASQPSPSQNSGQAELIRSMVSGLAERLEQEGGSIAEWTRLVRSYLVLGENERARLAYDKALLAYPEPDTEGRAELDTLAGQAGLIGEAE
ncbi:MAG TPA: c-type cytochrome biogenesis protein CcmI [Devosia sp.]|nr:c-type cytochrome biogenesis protein CcmI [Devosia sp.]